MRMKILSAMLGALLAVLITPGTSQAIVRTITFPVLGQATFRDDFGDPRSGGRTHQGNDIFAAKHRPLVAAVNGYVIYQTYPEAYYGYSIGLLDASGYRYIYIHMNNDTPATDDGQGNPKFTFAPDIFPGAPVVRGQLVGYVGDSGNAERTSPHLHFEIWTPDGDAVSPYSSLIHASRVLQPVVAPALPGEILPFGQFTGGAHVALGNVDANSVEPELVVAPGPGGGPTVRVYNTVDNRIVGQFRAYNSTMRSGVEVATGDINGDGVEEIIVAPGRGTAPQVRVYDVSGTLLKSFNAYSPSFLGGVRVAAADVDADGKAEIITGPGRGGGPQVRVFDAETGTIVSQFFAYNKAFRGGIDVAAIPASEGNEAIIVTSPGTGGGPQVRAFDRGGKTLGGFFSGDKTFRGGVRVAAADVDASNAGVEIVTVAESNGQPIVRVMSGSGEQLAFYREFERWWTGGYDIAVDSSGIWIASTEGGRRASVRKVGE